MTRLFAAGFVCAVLTGAMSTIGCSSADAPATGDGCVENGAAALKTCAKATTLKGLDVSTYEGTVNWAQVKADGQSFTFARISDGLNFPDAQWAKNWPGAKNAGVIRGAYQYFRPGQDPSLQAKMVIDKLAAAGGLEAGDLPPVLDLETADGQPSATVVAHAKTWLAAIEAATGVKPIVYTAAFMSDVIGTSFGAYTLWVANYGATCPTMPSGWTDWQFWQNDDSGTVTGVSGTTDTDFFNGTLAQLKALTIQPATPSMPAPSGGGLTGKVAETPKQFGGNTPKDGSQGSTLGSGTPHTGQEDGAQITPCQ